MSVIVYGHPLPYAQKVKIALLEKGVLLLGSDRRRRRRR